MNKIIKKSYKKTIATLTMLYFLSLSAFAENIANSKVVKGTEKLGNDLINALGVLAPIACGVVGIYFGIRMAMADEQDKKTWKNRLSILFVGFIITIVIVGLLKVIASYYK